VGASSPQPCGPHRVDGTRPTHLPVNTDVLPLGLGLVRRTGIGALAARKALTAFAQESQELPRWLPEQGT